MFASVNGPEQAPQFLRLGAGIQMSPNAMRVLRGIGLEGRIRATAFQPSSWTNRDWDTGRLLLEKPGSLALSPDGHGGTLAALRNAKLFDILRRRGVRHVFYFQVDNPLVKVADPLFLGQHIHARAQVSSKVTPKLSPKDKVGNFVSYDNHCAMIEYIHLPERIAEQTDASGKLLFRAGNPAIHIFDLDFLEARHARERKGCEGDQRDAQPERKQRKVGANAPWPSADVPGTDLHDARRVLTREISGRPCVSSPRRDTVPRVHERCNRPVARPSCRRGADVRQHCGGNSRGAGTSYGIGVSRIFALARTMRCASVRGVMRKALAISSVVNPHTSRKVSATRASGDRDG